MEALYQEVKGGSSGAGIGDCLTGGSAPVLAPRRADGRQQRVQQNLEGFPANGTETLGPAPGCMIV